jgi:hypothetical protein
MTMFGQHVGKVIKVSVTIPGSFEHFKLSVHPVKDLDIRSFMASHTVLMVVNIDHENHLILPESLSGDYFGVPGTHNNCFGYSIHDYTLAFGHKRKQLPIDKMTFVGFPDCPDILETLYIRTNTQTQKWANDPRNYAFVYFTTIKGATVDVVTAFLDQQQILALTDSSAKVRAAFVKDELPLLIDIFDEFEVVHPFFLLLYTYLSFDSQAKFTATPSATAGAASATAGATSATAGATSATAGATSATAGATSVVGAATEAAVATSVVGAAVATSVVGAAVATAAGAAGTWTPIHESPRRTTPEFVPQKIPIAEPPFDHIEQIIADFEQKTTAILNQAKNDLSTLKRKRQEHSLAIQTRDATIQHIEARRAAALAEANDFSDSKKNRRIIFANEEADEDIAALPIPSLDFNPSFDKLFFP